MNLLIDLYKNLKLNVNQQIGYIADRKCEVIEDLDFYKNQFSDNIDTLFHINSVISAKEKDKRVYNNIYGNLSDSHNEIEKLGVCKYARNYSVIISLEDSLDYIFHRLCGARIENLRNIENYILLSRSVLKLNYEGMGSVSFGVLRNADTNLANYLDSIFSKTEGTSEERINIFLQEVIKDILVEANNILSYITFSYLGSLEKGTAIPRSKSLCSFVLTSDKKLEEEIVIKSEGFDNYLLKIKSYENKEYLYRTQELYVGG